MVGKIKYLILKKLLMEICLKSRGCNNCYCDDERYPWECAKDYCSAQARRIWKIEDTEAPF